MSLNSAAMYTFPWAFVNEGVDEVVQFLADLGITHVVVASLYHAVEGLRVLLDAGLGAVRADSLAKTGLALERLDAMDLPGLRLRSPRHPERRGAMVILEAPEADRLSRWLKTRGVYTDSRRNEVLRFSPFVWNGRDDVERCLDAIEEAVSTGAHLRYEAPAEAGPVT